MKRLTMSELEARVNNRDKYNEVRVTTLINDNNGPIISILFTVDGIYLRAYNVCGFPCAINNADAVYKAIAKALQAESFGQNRTAFIKELNETPIKPYLVQRAGKSAIFHLIYVKGTDSYYTRYGVKLTKYCPDCHVIAEIPRDMVKETEVKIKYQREIEKLKKKGKLNDGKS